MANSRRGFVPTDEKEFNKDSQLLLRRAHSGLKHRAAEAADNGFTQRLSISG